MDKSPVQRLLELVDEKDAYIEVLEEAVRRSYRYREWSVEPNLYQCSVCDGPIVTAEEVPHTPDCIVPGLVKADPH